MEFKPGVTKTAQVADHMRRRIASGDWVVGQAIPGLADLEEEYKVSFGTVRAAQRILVGQGLLSEPEQGISTRVVGKPPALDAHEALGRIRSTYRSLGEELEHLAATPGFGAQPRRMELDHLNNNQVHDLARFQAAAAALTHGYHSVQFVGRQTRLKVDGNTVQVSSRRQPGSPWQVNVNHPVVNDAAAMIFVDLTSDASDFYIAPAQWVRDDVKRHHDSWLASKGGVRPRNPESGHHAVELDHIRQWHQRWDVLAAGQVVTR